MRDTTVVLYGSQPFASGCFQDEGVENVLGFNHLLSALRRLVKEEHLFLVHLLGTEIGALGIFKPLQELALRQIILERDLQSIDFKLHGRERLVFPEREDTAEDVPSD